MKFVDDDDDGDAAAFIITSHQCSCDRRTGWVTSSRRMHLTSRPVDDFEQTEVERRQHVPVDLARHSAAAG